MTWFLKGYKVALHGGSVQSLNRKIIMFFSSLKVETLYGELWEKNKEESFVSENPYGHYKMMVSWVTNIRMSYWWIMKRTTDQMMTFCLDMSAIMIKVKVRLKGATLFPEIQTTRKYQTFSPNACHVLKSSRTLR